MPGSSSCRGVPSPSRPSQQARRGAGEFNRQSVTGGGRNQPSRSIVDATIRGRAAPRELRQHPFVQFLDRVRNAAPQIIFWTAAADGQLRQGLRRRLYTVLLAQVPAGLSTPQAIPPGGA